MTFTQLVKKFWPAILLFGSAFIGLAIVTALDLNELESGKVETVRLWAPIWSFYERFGYWAAVLFTPVLGIACGAVLCWKLMKDGTLNFEPPQPHAESDRGIE